MLINYLKIAWRNLARNKVYSFINITGLAIGLASCMLIVLYVAHEHSFNKFHKNANRIFSVQIKMKLADDSLFMPYLNYSAAPLIKNTEPTVESFMRIKKGDRNTIIQNQDLPSIKFAENKFLFADSNFFNFFSFKLLQGNAGQVLQNPFSVVISKNAATKYFGSQDAVGKVLRYNNAYNLLVTGVAENPPSNSSLEYDFVVPVSCIKQMQELKDLILNDENEFSTYFLMKSGGDISRVESGLSQMAKAKERNHQVTSRYIGTPLRSYINPDADRTNTKYLKIFPFIAAFVLLLALINYMSLSTARAVTRAKEVGVKKVVGASRKIIAIQFFTESALYTIISFAIGYLLCLYLQPVFLQFLQIKIDSSFIYSSSMLLSYAVLFIITVLLAATYPSIILSGYKPVSVLYGKFHRQTHAVGVRKFFTVFQFSISIILIICGIVMTRQMNFFRHANTGIERENVLMVPFSAAAGKHTNALKKDLQSLSSIQKLSIALHPMFKRHDMMGVTPPNTSQMILMPTLSVDQNFISLLGLKWKIPPVDPLFYKSANTAVLNETAVEKLNLGLQPVNQKVDQFVVAGVLKDFNWSSLQNKIDGLCLFITADDDTAALWSQNGGCAYLKTYPGANIPLLIKQVQSLHQKYDPANAFEYDFMDDAFNAMYKAEERLSRIFNLFMGLTLFIACLGLFGLATFMAVQRTKEIGIRKILGASVMQVSSLMSKDFVKLVLIAFLIASPIAWWSMNKWLQNFAYRIPVTWWVFVVSGLGVVFIAMLTVSFQAIKAATANPVKNLRTE